MGRSSRVSNRRSRLVRIPASFPPASVMGTPEILYFFITSSASKILFPGCMVMGSTIMPLSERFTLSTSVAWSSRLRLLWMTPRPPCWAMAMASRDSVTVSIAEETMGTFKRIFRVRRVLVSTREGRTSLRAGNSSTSSKVRPSGITPSIMNGSPVLGGIIRARRGPPCPRPPHGIS